MLEFFGRGSAFSDSHNSAFFFDNKDLILIDCPATAFQKIKRLNFSNIDNIYILVTHTHGDHAGGIGMTAQYSYFVLHKIVTVIAPSKLVYDDLNYLLKHIEGCEDDWVNIITADRLNKDWLTKPIPTSHSKTLENKCFGYLLNINNSKVIYTGDTAELIPFLSYLEPYEPNADIFLFGNFGL